MTSVICTLFEGHYHFGVAALANSLYQQGYRGEVYAGYRGELPGWTAKATDNHQLNWKGAKTLHAAEGLIVHFLPLTTKFHLTNYKPDFMLELWNGAAQQAEAMFYFDPDIVVIAPWAYINEWVNCGIAVCEDLKSPLEKFHPRRMGWRQYYEKYSVELKFKNAIYVNGGFVGIKKSEIAFIEKWKLLQVYMADLIGGLDKSSITSHSKLSDDISFTFSPFGATDQDALNATIEACDFNYSYMHQEAMALKAGGPVLMAHALGTPKSWNYQPISNFVQGNFPRYVDKQFWSFVEYPINIYSKSKVKSMKYSLKVFSFLSRLYSK